MILKVCAEAAVAYLFSSLRNELASLLALLMWVLCESICTVMLAQA